MTIEEAGKLEMLGGKVMKLSPELSRELYEQYPDEVEKNLCYNNMFNLSSCIYRKGGKIAYGYMEVTPGIYVRHAFATLNGLVVDPLFCLWKNENKKDKTYIVLKEFETFEEYMCELTKNRRGTGYDADMRHTMGESFAHFTIEAMMSLRNIIFVD